MRGVGCACRVVVDCLLILSDSVVTQRSERCVQGHVGRSPTSHHARGTNKAGRRSYNVAPFWGEGRALVYKAKTPRTSKGSSVCFVVKGR
jgi:hypothetical protein